MMFKLKLKNLAAIFLIACILIAGTPLSAVKVQAAQNNWYDSVVSSFTQKGYFDGKTNPDNFITVKEFVKLAVLSGTYNHAEDAVSTAVAKGWVTANEISDLNKQLTRETAAKIAMRMLSGNNIPIISDTETNGLIKEDQLTRETAAKILMRLLSGDTALNISDAEKAGLIKGDINGNLRGNDNITYAETMQLLTNVKNAQNAAIDNTPVRKITVEEFFANPIAAGYSMSEDGEYLYFAGEYEGRLNIFRQKIDGEEGGEPERLTSVTDRNIAGSLIKDDYLIYLADTGGDENYHIYTVKIGDNQSEKNITPYTGVRVMPIDLLENVENEILVMMNKNNPQVFDVYKLNVVTGELTLVAENPGDVQGWLTDWDGNVRIAYVSDSIDTYIMYRENDEEPFELLATASDADTFQPIAFSKDGKLLYMLSNVSRNTTALISLELATGKETVIYANDKYDIAGASLNDDGSAITRVAYYDDKYTVVYFDKELEKVYKKIADTFETDDFSAQLSKDKTKAMVVLASDINPGEYYYYDITEDLVLPLGQAMPWLAPNDLCEMIPVSYTARDGLVIHGYLTLPKNTAPDNLPLVVNPHGGPWARDIWGYNPEVQLLANQGYAVLQMNFRGSTGYGKEFVYAGDKQWGRAMQDDITDGVEWLIKIGLADADKIAIYGASYGGYATLAGITLTPDLYAAAVDYVGVSNLLTFMETIPPYWEGMRNYLYDRIGHPEEDYDDLYSYSPVNLVDNIITPLFVAQGANDPRVNKAESDQIVEALRKRGVEVDYMVKNDEGHGFMFVQNQYDFYNAMLEFLAKYLKD